MVHPDEKLIFRYISGRASEEECLEIDEHIAECSECLQRIRALLYLRDNFEMIWNSWTPQEHGRVYQKWQLAMALTSVDQPFAEKAMAWLERLHSVAEINIRVLIDLKKKVTIISAGVVPPAFRPVHRFAFAGIGDPGEARKIQEHTEKSSDLLSKDQTEEAMREIEKVIRINPRAVQSSTLDFLDKEDKVTVECVVDSRMQRARVFCWPIVGKEAPSLVLLISSGDPSNPLVGELKPVEGADYLMAEFENVIDGKMRITVGPF